jgi:hypothetical protein
MKPGATGNFPSGQLDDTDEGELAMAISAYQGNVRIDFGKQVVWLALPPALARQLAAAIIKHADELEGK